MADKINVLLASPWRKILLGSIMKKVIIYKSPSFSLLWRTAASS